MNKILCIVGQSGSGKTTIANYIEKRWGIPQMQSYTTRRPRYEGEEGHVFVTELEYEVLQEKDMLAYTKFGDNHYWALHKDVQEKIVYVIDEKGLKEMIDKYGDRYEITSFFITRLNRTVDEKRKQRDEGMFNFNIDYDFIIENNNSKETLFMEVDLLLYENKFIEEVDADFNYDEYL